MTETELIEAVSDQYRRDGYTVARTLGPDLGTSMAFPNVDLIATKGNEITAIEVQRQEDHKLRRIVFASGIRGENHSLDLLAEAERLLTPETQQSALLMAWTALEAAMRERLAWVDDGIDNRSGKDLVRQVAKQSLLNPDECVFMQRGMILRALIGRGMRPADDTLTLDTTVFLLSIIRKLKHGKDAENAFYLGTQSIIIKKERLMTCCGVVVSLGRPVGYDAPIAPRSHPSSGSSMRRAERPEHGQHP